MRKHAYIYYLPANVKEAKDLGHAIRVADVEQPDGRIGVKAMAILVDGTKFKGRANDMPGNVDVLIIDHDLRNKGKIFSAFEDLDREFEVYFVKKSDEGFQFIEEDHGEGVQDSAPSTNNEQPEKVDKEPDTELEVVAAETGEAVKLAVEGDTKPEKTRNTKGEKPDTEADA